MCIDKRECSTRSTLQKDIDSIWPLSVEAPATLVVSVPAPKSTIKFPTKSCCAAQHEAKLSWIFGKPFEETLGMYPKLLDLWMVSLWTSS